MRYKLEVCGQCLSDKLYGLGAPEQCPLSGIVSCNSAAIRIRIESQGPLNGGGFKRGASRSGLVLPFLSFLVLFGVFPIFLGFFPICSGMVRGFSRFVLFLFGLSRAPTRNSPERVRDTIWTFPEKKWETPRFGNPPV